MVHIYSLILIKIVCLFDLCFVIINVIHDLVDTANSVIRL